MKARKSISVLHELAKPELPKALLRVGEVHFSDFRERGYYFGEKHDD
jgi:hypothetical protein